MQTQPPAQPAQPPGRMALEIAEQPEATRRLLAFLLGEGDAPPRNQEQDSLNAALAAANRISFAACGSSRHAALLGRFATLRLAALPAEVEEAHELVALGANVWRGVGLCVVLSQSGETQDTLEALALAEQFAVPVLALCNVAPSALADRARWAWDVQGGEERAVPATKSFVAQGVACICLALRAGRIRGPKLGPQAAAMAQLRRETSADLRALPDQIEALLQGLAEGEAGHSALLAAAAAVDAARLPVLLGRGPGTAVAHEGALKLREAAYVPAQAYALGEFKHGPMAMLEPTQDVVVALLDGEDPPGPDANLPGTGARSLAAVLRLAELGVKLVVVLAADSPHAAQLRQACPSAILLTTPATGGLTWPLLAAVVLQKLTWAVAIRRGLNPDQPRYLVKSIHAH